MRRKVYFTALFLGACSLPSCSVEDASHQNNSSQLSADAVKKAPGTRYQVFEKKNSNVYVAETLLRKLKLELKPEKSVLWEKTDLARGLVEKERLTIPQKPAKATEKDIRDWVAKLGFNFSVRLEWPTEDDLKDKGKFEDRVNRIQAFAGSSSPQDLKAEFKKTFPDKSKAGDTEDSRKAWRDTELLPYLETFAVKVEKWHLDYSKSDERVRRYTFNWEYLKKLYEKRPASENVKHGLAPIQATFEIPEGKVERMDGEFTANFCITLPAGDALKDKIESGHPVVATYLSFGTKRPAEPLVIHLIRKVGDREVEFFVPLDYLNRTDDRGMDQDYSRLMTALIYDGDVLRLVSQESVSKRIKSLAENQK